MGRGGETHRLFIATYPPPDAAARLLGSLDDLELPAHTRTRADQLHLTLLFIGDTPIRQIDSVVESVTRAAAGIGRFNLRPTTLVSLPTGPEPRLVAAEFEPTPPLLEMRRRLVTRLARQARERGRFTPHMTLCRFRHGESKRLDPVPLEGPEFGVHRIAVVRSVLLPQGAEHRTIAEVDLSQVSSSGSAPGSG
jgi:RNA 2',3'-cyclic 3'-phosphodiesterase